MATVRITRNLRCGWLRVGLTEVDLDSTVAEPLRLQVRFMSDFRQYKFRTTATCGPHT